MKDTVRITVVMGGPSAEHEISRRSGESIVAALTRRAWHAKALMIPSTRTDAEACQCVRTALEQDRPDLVVIALHGSFGEDGTVQQVCEELGLPYTGSDVEASRLGLDKVTSRMRFEAAQLVVPPWRVVSTTQGNLETSLRGLRYPLVVKPIRQGSSLGISMVTDPSLLRAAIDLAARYETSIADAPSAAALTSASDDGVTDIARGAPGCVLVEEYIHGRELTVGILSEQALPIIEIRPAARSPARTVPARSATRRDSQAIRRPGPRFFDYTAKYTPGQTAYEVPAPLLPELSARIQEMALRAHRALGCRHFSRVDLILIDAHLPVILEVNTIPGMTAMSLLPKAAACAGISYDELCERLALLALSSPAGVARELIGQRASDHN